MSVLTDLASAEVKRTVKELFGVLMTRPAVLVSDGVNVVYAADVNITEHDPTGRINQWFKDDKEKKRKQNDRESGALTGLPGQAPEDWQLDDSLPGAVDTVLHNVPLAKATNELIHADVGTPVSLERNKTGNWQITGFSIEQPGTFFMYPVDLEDGLIETVIDLSIDTRLLTYAELGTQRPYGFLPYGASAIYQGGVFLRTV